MTPPPTWRVKRTRTGTKQDYVLVTRHLNGTVQISEVRRYSVEPIAPSHIDDELERFYVCVEGRRIQSWFHEEYGYIYLLGGRSHKEIQTSYEEIL